MFVSYIKKDMFSGVGGGAGGGVGIVAGGGVGIAGGGLDINAGVGLGDGLGGGLDLGLNNLDLGLGGGNLFDSKLLYNFFFWEGSDHLNG